MNKPKLLHVVESFGGGVFTFLADLSNALCDRYDITIAYTLRPQTPEHFQRYFDDSIRLVPLRFFKRSIGLHDVRAWSELRGLIRREKPDLIHLHSSKAGFIGRFAVNGRRIPVFYTPHGYSFLMKDVSQKKRRAYRLIEKIGGLRRCTTVCVSAGEGEAARSVAHNICVINNGVSMKTLAPYLNCAGDCKTVATVGRICPQKAPDLFCEIALLLPEFSFVWIGDGEQCNLLAADNIRVTGWLKRDEALSELSACGIFLLPSRWEGLPISLLEAMYLKKRCVVSDCVGNRDVIESGRNGIIAHTAGEYAAAIRDMAAGLPGTEDMAERAHQDVCRIYNTQRMAEEYDALYQAAFCRRAESKR